MTKEDAAKMLGPGLHVCFDGEYIPMDTRENVISLKEIVIDLLERLKEDALLSGQKNNAIRD